MQLLFFEIILEMIRIIINIFLKFLWPIKILVKCIILVGIF